ncbi:hypothetical protein MSAN_01177100 [Mycena sanguinolenta]|uniref:Uncharacterized protein n=1 Tax=Mycena sanguinolenta TaxID=230812 RepID=A0A8H6YHV6_9AGAR|nr:hypothetical protein MSAN_01177100 [Mycena sanguinolenta]
MSDPVSFGLLCPVSLGLIYLYMFRKRGARRQPSSSSMTCSRPSDVPHASEDADLALAIALSLEEAKACVPAIADVNDDPEDADITRAIALSLQEAKMQQRPRPDILPAKLGVPAYASVYADPDVLSGVDTSSTADTLVTMGALESSPESRTNTGWSGHSISTHVMIGPIEEAVGSQRSVGCSDCQCNGATGGVGGLSEGPSPSLTFDRSLVHLNINGGRGGNGGAAGRFNGDDGTGQAPIFFNFRRWLLRLGPRGPRRRE